MILCSAARGRSVIVHPLRKLGFVFRKSEYVCGKLFNGHCYNANAQTTYCEC